MCEISFCPANDLLSLYLTGPFSTESMRMYAQYSIARMAATLDGLRTSGKRTNYKMNKCVQLWFELLTENIDNCSYDYSVKIINADTGALVSEISKKNVIDIGFSPKRTYLSTWERPGLMMLL